ncbi:hypothetical protein T06_8868 [Trichinella sp. T6]|nr:hypothetical protein T06_8868 [Trichinella sp. T6]
MSNYWAHAWYLFESLAESTSMYSENYSEYLGNHGLFENIECSDQILNQELLNSNSSLTISGRFRVYIKDMPLHTLSILRRTLIEVMDAISKQDCVDSPFH